MKVINTGHGYTIVHFDMMGVQRAQFEAIWPYFVDVGSRIHEFENINAPYKHLDDPIPLWPKVAKWLKNRCGEGDSWPFNPQEKWGRYGNSFGFKTEEDLEAFKLAFGLG